MNNQNTGTNTNTPYGDSSQNHAHQTVGIQGFIDQNIALRKENYTLREQIQEMLIRLYQQEVLANQQPEQTLASLSATNNKMTIELNEIKGELFELKQENKLIKEENRNLNEKLCFPMSNNDENK